MDEFRFRCEENERLWLPLFWELRLLNERPDDRPKDFPEDRFPAEASSVTVSKLTTTQVKRVVANFIVPFP